MKITLYATAWRYLQITLHHATYILPVMHRNRRNNLCVTVWRYLTITLHHTWVSTCWWDHEAHISLAYKQLQHRGVYRHIQWATCHSLVRPWGTHITGLQAASAQRCLQTLTVNNLPLTGQTMRHTHHWFASSFSTKVSTDTYSEQPATQIICHMHH